MAKPWEKYGAPQPGVIPIGPRDTTRQDAEARQAAKDARDAADKERDYQLQRKKFIAELATKGQTLDANDNIVPIPNWQPPLTPDQMQDRQGRAGRLNSLVAQINRTQELGNKGPLATSGLSAIADYNPFSDANARFDTAGASLSQQGLGAFRVPGTGTVSDRDAIMFDRANLPQASTLDASNQEILRGLRNRVEEEYRALGLPAPQWVGTTGSEQQDERRDAAAIAGSGGGEPPIFPGNVQGGVRPPNVWMSDGTPMRDVPTQGSVLNAITGNTNTKYQRYPDIEKKVSQAFMAGASLEQLNQILASDPRTAGHFIRPTDYAEGAKARASGRKGDVTFTVGANVPLTRREEFSGSPTGTAATGFANMVSLGGVEALAPQQYADQKALNPNAALAGEVAGAVAGSQGIGVLGRQTIGRAFPGLLGGGSKARVARQVAQDAVYGGGYGGVANGDPVTGALAGGVGSFGGQVLGKSVGKALAGLTKDPFAETLEKAGVNSLTVGQNLGGMAARAEDRAMSMPGIGDIIRNRRMDAFDDFNLAAQRQAGEPIGATFPVRSNWVGDEGLPPQFGQAYDDATAGVRVPLDSQFSADMLAARARGASLPPDLAPRFNTAVNNRVLPVAQAGELTGDTYQQAMRGLKGYKSELTKPGFEADYRDALSGVQGALRGQMQRGGGESVVTGLANADQAYRLGKVIQEAQRKAVNGTQSGTGGVFTPTQLNNAATANARKFGGARPFAELGDAGQAVLPATVPDSGTAGRLMQFALPSALVGTGAGLGGASGGLDGAQTGAGGGLALAALLALGGTKGGQATLNKLLFSRGAKMKAVGSGIDKYKGLLGSALAPLMIEASQ